MLLLITRIFENRMLYIFRNKWKRIDVTVIFTTWIIFDICIVYALKCKIVYALPFDIFHKKNIVIFKNDSLKFKKIIVIKSKSNMPLSQRALCNGVKCIYLVGWRHCNIKAIYIKGPALCPTIMYIMRCRLWSSLSKLLCSLAFPKAISVVGLWCPSISFYLYIWCELARQFQSRHSRRPCDMSAARK